jgi:hypothetical protein
MFGRRFAELVVIRSEDKSRAQVEISNSNRTFMSYLSGKREREFQSTFIVTAIGRKVQ